MTASATLQFFGHPFSSYTQKVLIALWADETPFEYRELGPDHPENGEVLRQHSPFGQFPLLSTYANGGLWIPGEAVDVRDDRGR